MGVRQHPARVVVFSGVEAEGRVWSEKGRMNIKSLLRQLLLPQNQG